MNIGDFVESKEGFFFVGDIINSRIIPMPDTNIIHKKGIDDIDGADIDDVIIHTTIKAIQKQQKYSIGDTFKEEDGEFVITEFPYEDMLIAHSIDNDFLVFRSIREME